MATERDDRDQQRVQSRSGLSHLHDAFARQAVCNDTPRRGEQQHGDGHRQGDRAERRVGPGEVEDHEAPHREHHVHRCLVPQHRQHEPAIRTLLQRRERARGPHATAKASGEGGGGGGTPKNGFAHGSVCTDIADDRMAGQAIGPCSLPLLALSDTRATWVAGAVWADRSLVSLLDELRIRSESAGARQPGPGRCLAVRMGTWLRMLARCPRHMVEADDMGYTNDPAIFRSIHPVPIAQPLPPMQTIAGSTPASWSSSLLPGKQRQLRATRCACATAIRMRVSGSRS